jgi:hypothetical protein
VRWVFNEVSPQDENIKKQFLNQLWIFFTKSILEKAQKINLLIILLVNGHELLEILTNNKFLPPS